MAETVATGSGRRKLAAILHADVAGFSRLMGEDEAGTHRRLGELRGAVDPLILAYGGRIVGTAGDSLLADFTSVVDALACAVAMQRAARAVNEPAPTGSRLEWRIGVNLGDVIIDGDDIFGDGVNIAARLQELAQPGTVCIPHTVYEQVRNKLAFDYRPLGLHRVKNIAEPVRAYAVGAAEAAAIRHRPRPRRALALAASVIMLAAGGLLAWAVLTGVGRELLGLAPATTPAQFASPNAPGRLAGRPSVAVLPFENLSGDPGQDYFSDGIAEDVITALGRFSEVLVIAKSASFAFKRHTLAPAEIGRRLDARYLLDGSIRRAGERVRVAVGLTEAATGRAVWADTYDGEIKNIFAVQQDIARHVAGAAAVKLARFEEQRVLAKPTDSLPAYDYVLRGRQLAGHTRAGNEKARELFQRAIDLDPNFAAAYAALGTAEWSIVVSGWSEFPDEAMQRAETLAKKALALDPAITEAYRLLAKIDFFRRRYDRALTQLDLAFEFNPSDAETYRARGHVLVFAGRAAEAVSWLEDGLRFDRANLYANWGLCMADYFLGRYAEAAAACDRGLARNPERIAQTQMHPFLAAIYAEVGRNADAAGERAIVKRLSPFFDAERFAAQFGTPEARSHMLEGLKKAGFP